MSSKFTNENSSSKEGNGDIDRESRLALILDLQ
jgi:hypothetical protein